MQCTCVSCNMGKRDFHDMYICLRVAGLRVEGIYIKQITTAHITSDMYHFRHTKNPSIIYLNFNILQLEILIEFGLVRLATRIITYSLEAY